MIRNEFGALVLISPAQRVASSPPKARRLRCTGPGGEVARRGRLISVETAGSEVVAVATVDRAKTCRRRAENLFYA